MGRDLAIDLGTANTLVYRQGDGIVVREPTAVAIDTARAEVVAIGAEAFRRIGSDSGNVVGMRPLREGTITDFEVTQRFLEAVIRSAGGSRLQRPRVLHRHPVGQLRGREAGDGGGRGVRRRQRRDPGGGAAGGRDRRRSADPRADGAPDRGHRRRRAPRWRWSRWAGSIAGRTVRTGGFDLDAAIIEHIRDTYGVAIGENAAEEIEDRDRVGVPGAGRPRRAGAGPRSRRAGTRWRCASRTTRSARRSRRRCVGSSTPRSGPSATPRPS